MDDQLEALFDDETLDVIAGDWQHQVENSHNPYTEPLGLSEFSAPPTPVAAARLAAQGVADVKHNIATVGLSNTVVNAPLLQEMYNFSIGGSAGEMTGEQISSFLPLSMRPPRGGGSGARSVPLSARELRRQKRKARRAKRQLDKARGGAGNGKLSRESSMASEASSSAGGASSVWDEVEEEEAPLTAAQQQLLYRTLHQKSKELHGNGAPPSATGGGMPTGATISTSASSSSSSLLLLLYPSIQQG